MFLLWQCTKRKRHVDGMIKEDGTQYKQTDTQIRKEQEKKRVTERKREIQGGGLFLDTFVLCVDATQHWNALDQNTVLQGSAVTQECFGE